MVAKTNQVEKPVRIIPMLNGDLFAILLLGAGMGLLVWMLGALLDRYVFDVYFCKGDINAQCESAKNYAAVAATLVGSVLALAGLVRLRIYRPLLVLIASVLSVWGVAQMSWNLGWFTGALVVAALYALAFGVFGWIARIREFWIALVVMALLVIAVRIALMV